MPQYCIHIDILEKIFDRIERELSYSNDSDYRKMLGEINKVNEKLYDQLNADINYIFTTDRNESDKTTTLLHFATEKRYPKIIKLLLSNDANVNVTNSGGNVPLHLAVKNGNLEIVQELLNRGADINAVTEYDDTPLHLAAENDNLEIVQELLNRGADISAVTEYDDTPLHLAAENDNLEIVQELLNRGADVNAVNKKNDTPLHAAVKNSCSDVVEPLLCKGADTEKKNNDGEIPLESYVSTYDDIYDEEIDKILIKYTLVQNINIRKPNFLAILQNTLARNNRDENVDSLARDLSEYWDGCKNQIELLRDVNICSIEDEQVSLYDFLTANDAKLGRYVKNSDILHMLDPDQLFNRFPMLAETFPLLTGAVLYKFEKGDLYSKAKHAIPLYKDESGEKIPLPTLVQAEINKYLGNKDRQNLLKALTPLQGNSQNPEQVNNENKAKELGESNSESNDTEKELKSFTREPISIFKEIQRETEQIKKQNLEGLLNELRSFYPNELKIGAAIGKGDCFFDAVAQGLNELKDKGLIVSDKKFSASSLREECESYAGKYKDEIIQDAKGGGYSVALQGPYGPIQDPETKENKIDNEEAFKCYLKEIKKTSEESDNPIWGRPEIEGKMICEKYKVQIKIMDLRNEGVAGLHVTTGKVGENGNTVYVVNYKNHFIPLLSNLEQDIEQDQEIYEEIYSEEDLLPLDEAELNRHEVSTWEKPKISSTIEHGTSTRFDGQIILQLENDPVVMEAAVRLTAKHPENSVVVQLDTQGNYQIVYSDFDVLEEKENLRWQVVGHGRTDKTLGGYSATELAEKVKDFTIILYTDHNINSFPKHISLVGCSLVDNVEMNYARELALSLDEYGIRADIAARSARIAVTGDGRKLTEDSSGNWSHKISEDKVIYSWNQDGELELQIGKRAAELLKSMDLAQNFHQAMSELYRSNQLQEGKWWPILRNVTEDTKNNSYQVQFVNAEQQLQTVTTHDRHIIDFIEDYNEKLATIKEKYGNANTQGKSVFDIESIDGLNSAFIVKTLIPWFANKSHMAVADNNVPEILKTALEVHTWVNLAQIGHGAVLDIAKTAGLYRAAIAISEGKEVASEMTSSLRHISTGMGVLLNLGSLVLDSIELAHAQNEAQKAIFCTQLAFDSAGLVASTVSIGASIAGASTIAAFAGAGGVILGGLAVGATALAQAFSAVAMNAQAVGNYFADLDAAYSQGGYRHTTKTMKDGTKYDVMEPIPGAVITTLDLPNKYLTFDSQYIYRTHHNFEGSGNNFRWSMPNIILDKTQAINIRESIGYPDTKVNFDYDSTTLILPTTPKSYLNYEYNILPFVLERHDRGFDIARRLEENGRFDFDFYTFPSERVVRKLRPEYMETSIKVILDEQDREILITQLPQSIKGKLSYQLCGNGSKYRISLQEGVSLQLDNSNSSWILDAQMLGSAEINIHENLLKIGNVEITLPDESCGTISIIDSNSDIFTVDRENKEITLLEVNNKQFTDWQALHNHLKLLTNHSHPDNHNSFVAIDNYQPVTGGGNVGRAFYDVVADRFIYTNEPEWIEFLSSAVLAKAEGDKAWFYRKTEIWQVEIATGKILKQYLPFNGTDMEFIDSHVLQHDNQLYMLIKQKLGNDNVIYTYHIEDEALKLVAIDGNTALIAELENSKGKNLSCISVVPNSNQWLSRSLASFDHQIKATLADVVKISDCWLFCDENDVKDFIKANAEPQDLVLVFVSEHEGYFFYSNKEHSIYFQKDIGTQATAVNVNNVKSIFSHNQKHFALTYEGTLWSLDDRGTARLAGVTADWLSHHRENLIKDLGQLADNTDSKFNNLLLLGVQDSNGNSVSAWYDNIDDLVIQGGPNLNAEHNLTYLGLANDNKQAWIFDANDQAIYRQPLKDLVLNEKLVLAVPGDSAELFHPEQKYVNVMRDGTNLRIEISGGAVLLLPVDSDLTNKPTLIAFHVEEHKPEQILSALQALIDDYALPPAIRLLIESDQEPAWYLTEEKKIIYGNGFEDGHFLYYLGKAAGSESWYIHDKNTGQLWSVSSDQSVDVGNYSFIHLEQDYLILQVSKVIPHSLPQLQGVSNLIISSKVSGDYRLDSSLLKHYQQIVIDGQGTIELENDSTFSLQRSGKGIILHCDSFNTDILISNIEQDMQQVKICDTQLPLNQLLTELDSNNNYSIF